MHRYLLVSIWLGLLGSSMALQAQTIVGFNHKETPNNSMAAGYTFGHEEVFEVQITETDTDKFDYSVTGIEILPSAGVLRSDSPSSTTTKTIKMQHDKKYGGYIVRVAVIAAEQAANAAGKKLPEQRIWYISVATMGWHTQFSTGLVGSRLVEPKIILKENDSGMKAPFRDERAEDELDFSFAGFATFFHDRWGNETHGIGATLGVDVSGTEIGVLIGPTWRFGDHAALTVGRHWRKVDDLPAGVDFGVAFEGDELALDSRIRDDWFFAISIRGFTDRQAKSFAEAVTKKNESTN